MNLNIIFSIFVINFIDLSRETNQTNNEKTEEKILSRKRRYLIFPEGSSLQLVYDQTIPVVGIELVFTVGVTVALAYELPSEPFSKLNQKLRDRLLSQRPNTTDAPDASRIDSNSSSLNYIDTNSNTINKYDNHQNILEDDYKKSQKYYNYYTNPAVKSSISYSPLKSSSLNYNLSPTSNKFSYYFNGGNKGNNYYSKTPSSSASVSPTSTQYNKWSPNNLLTFVSSLAKQLNAKRIKNGPNENNNRRKTFYPILGKRKKRNLIEEQEKFNKKKLEDDENRKNEMKMKALKDDEEEEMQFCLEHHRKTRQVLYKKIEKFLVSRGRNGKICVLKALCETGQRHHEKGTGTFVGEIMRAIFSLPKLKNESFTAEDYDKLHHLYDEAHGHGPEKNCAELYSECRESIWSADFIF